MGADSTRRRGTANRRATAAVALGLALIAAGTARASLNPPEREWLGSVVPLAKAVDAANADVARIAANPQAVALVFAGDTETVLRLARALGPLARCGRDLAAAGPPPPRLVPFRRAYASVCVAETRAARMIAKGVDFADAGLVARGADMIRQGDGLRRAQDALKRL